MTDYENNTAIKNFREYLRIPSVQPNVNYDDCVKFLRAQAAGLGLPVAVHEVVPGKPVVVVTWVGREPTAPSILLNSHMDVVPVFEKSWSHAPFSAHLDAEGRIFARGSQDMKCVGVQYLEAIRALRHAGVQLKRTIHVTFVPDEEIGGHDGMSKFVHTDSFEALRVGFALDEGMASPDESYLLFYGERSIWQLHIHCTGPPGHGSLLFNNTAGEKLRRIIDKFMDMREKEKSILESNPSLTVGDVTSVNLTQVYGGVQSNVIPEKLTAVFDIRVAVDVDHTHLEEKIKGWCREAGEGVTYEFEQRNPCVESTRLDHTNPYWGAFKDAADHMKLKLECRIFPAATDSRYLRRAGVPALGFSPISRTPVLLHDHDECLRADVFLEGVRIYTALITAVANV